MKTDKSAGSLHKIPCIQHQDDKAGRYVYAKAVLDVEELISLSSGTFDKVGFKYLQMKSKSIRIIDGYHFSNMVSKEHTLSFAHMINYFVPF